MYTDPEFELVVRFVSHFDGLGLLKQGYGHPGNLPGMEVTVPGGEAGHHHVGVTNGLHLMEGRDGKGQGQGSSRHGSCDFRLLPYCCARYHKYLRWLRSQQAQHVVLL